MFQTVKNFIRILSKVDALAFPGEALDVRLIVGDRKNEPVSCSETREIRIRERPFVRYVSRLRRLWGYSQKKTLTSLAVHEIRHKLQRSGTKLWTEDNITLIRSLVDEEVFSLLQKWLSAETEESSEQIDAWIIESLCMRMILKGHPLKDIEKVLLSQPKE